MPSTRDNVLTVNLMANDGHAIHCGYCSNGWDYAFLYPTPTGVIEQANMTIPDCKPAQLVQCKKCKTIALLDPNKVKITVRAEGA